MRTQKSTETEPNNKKKGSGNKTGSTKIETDKRIQLKMPRTQIEDGQKLKWGKYGKGDMDTEKGWT